MFSYPDAARYRLGANYQQLPPNKPLSPIYSPYQRDGPGTINGNYGGDPDYVRSGFRAINFRQTHCYPEGHEVWNGKMQSYATEVTERDFEQPRELWEIIKGERAEGQFLENVVPTLVPIEEGLCDKAVGEFLSFVVLVVVGDERLTDVLEAMFARVDKGLGELLAEAVRKGRAKAACVCGK